MEPGTFDIESGHLGVGDNNAAGVLASVEFAAHSEAGFDGSSRDQLDDDAITDEWLGLENSSRFSRRAGTSLRPRPSGRPGALARAAGVSRKR